MSPKQLDMDDLANWSDQDLLDALKARYSKTVVPPCPVCGAELTLEACGGGEPTVWACGSHRPMDLKMGGHYDRSQFVDRRRGDRRVIELTERYAKARALGQPGRLGQLVREVWIAWAREQPDVGQHPSWLVPWEDLSERERDVDSRIAAAIVLASGEHEPIALPHRRCVCCARWLSGPLPHYMPARGSSRGWCSEWDSPSDEDGFCHFWSELKGPPETP